MKFLVTWHRKVKSEKIRHHNIPACSATQSTSKLDWKAKFCVTDLMGTPKSIHLSKHLKWLKLFSAQTWLVLTIRLKIGKTDFSWIRPQGQGLESGPWLVLTIWLKIGKTDFSWIRPQGQGLESGPWLVLTIWLKIGKTDFSRIRPQGQGLESGP